MMPCRRAPPIALRIDQELYLQLQSAKGVRVSKGEVGYTSNAPSLKEMLTSSFEEKLTSYAQREPT
jgi:hypothetical protein